jgi:hypothetical protein
VCRNIGAEVTLNLNEYQSFLMGVHYKNHNQPVFLSQQVGCDVIYIETIKITLTVTQEEFPIEGGDRSSSHYLHLYDTYYLDLYCYDTYQVWFSVRRLLKRLKKPSL